MGKQEVQEEMSRAPNREKQSVVGLRHPTSGLAKLRALCRLPQPTSLAAIFLDSNTIHCLVCVGDTFTIAAVAMLSCIREQESPSYVC